jgi:hypothetical protein
MSDKYYNPIYVAKTNPWEMAKASPKFEHYTHEQIDEMLWCELIEILNQDE